MKPFYYLFLLLLFSQCSNIGKMKADIYSSSINDDVRILNHVIEQLSNEKQTPAGELIVKVGSLFLGTPYVANTLEQDGDERLVINLREMDCTTFAESCLALTRTIKSREPGLEQYARELMNIRYRDANISGYASRLHYTTDWIYNNQQKKLVTDITKDINGYPYVKTINFMSTHPESYRHLSSNRQLVDAMAAIESGISGRQHYYIPKERISDFENQFQDGDIVALTTSINGLDVSHMGILVLKDGRIHLMHASTTAKKVVLSEETLREYLQNSKSVTGIIVARPL